MSVQVQRSKSDEFRELKKKFKELLAEMKDVENLIKENFEREVGKSVHFTFLDASIVDVLLADLKLSKGREELKPYKAVYEIMREFSKHVDIDEVVNDLVALYKAKKHPVEKVSIERPLYIVSYDPLTKEYLLTYSIALPKSLKAKVLLSLKFPQAVIETEEGKIAVVKYDKESKRWVKVKEFEKSEYEEALGALNRD